MKRILTLCLSLILILGLGTLFAFAETETDITIKYGKADLALTLIDPFDEEKQLPGFMNWGNGFMQDGRIYMECGGGSLYDIYNMTTVPLMENSTLGDHTYVVFAAENTSDGDIFFGFQPDVYYNDNTVHAYMSSELAKENPVKLIWKDGTVEDAKFWSQRSADREVFAVPYEFDGYIVIPHVVLVTDIKGSTPVTTDGKVDYVGFGLHALPDDASYMEFTITATYACSALPAYEKPETEAPETQAPETQAPETQAPETNAPDTAAPETTAPETTPPETQDETPAVTTADTSFASETVAGTTAETKTSDESGCASVVGTLAVLMTAVAGAVALKRKKEY